VRDRRGPPQRRRAAAEIDRRELAGEGIRAAVEFGNDGVAIALVGRLADLDREVTVRAQLAAPREMKVDA
jgi:hypothetical protein